MAQQFHCQRSKLYSDYLLYPICATYPNVVPAGYNSLMVSNHVKCYWIIDYLRQYQRTFVLIKNVDLTPTCSYTTIGSTEVYTFSSLFSSNKTISTAVQLSLANLYNPWSTFPFSPIVFQLYNTQNGATKITQSCSGISQTTTTLNTFNTFTLSGTFTTINLVNTNRVIQFNNKNPILQSGAQIKVNP